MQAFIDRKLKDYRAIGITSREFRVWLEQSDLWYWIYSELELDGTPIERGKIVAILDGKIVENASIDVYNFIHGYNAVYRDMKSCAEMDLDAEPKLLARWFEALLGRELTLRKGSPVVYEWNHIPPVAAEGAELMIAAMRSYAVDRRTDRSLRRMALLYLDTLKTYAYGADTIRAAGLLLAYGLLREGYPLPSLSLSDVEYNQLIDGYVNKGDAESFVNVLERSALNRLDSVLQLSRQAAELNDK